MHHELHRIRYRYDGGRKCDQNKRRHIRPAVVPHRLLRCHFANFRGGGGGSNVASGTFTITAEANDNAPTITHNLHTQKIAVLIYPTSAKISTGDGYRNWYAALITVNQIANGDTWTFDWTSYNSKFSGDEVVTLPNGNLRIGMVHQSPWPTQSHWYDAGNPAQISGLDSIELTDNTVRVRGTSNRRRWCCGTYNWIVAKME